MEFYSYPFPFWSVFLPPSLKNISPIEFMIDLNKFILKFQYIYISTLKISVITFLIMIYSAKKHFLNF